MCTWCPADVISDLSIRKCVSELDLCPCCHGAMTAGSVVRVWGPCRSLLSCLFFFMDHYDSLLRWSATVAITLVMDRYGSDYLCMAGKRASASSGAYRRVPQMAGVM